ncbi:MAG: enoyl-CoA hydratase/isomerase family protein [Gammaproteobacteria bacterium]|nr:enoyl-CoA hydratase/isomerase family protein [Gammaproteobacteria bacterium]
MPSIDLDYPAKGVCRITLNNPEVLNGFAFEMYDEMVNILEKIKYDTSIRVVVLTGAGRAFCSGHWVGAPGRQPWMEENLGPIQQDMYSMARIKQIPLGLRTLPQPVICALNGPAAGFGVALALVSDIVVAGTSGEFVNAFHNVGVGSEIGVSYLMSRMIGSQRTADFLFNARRVGAEEAARIGLVLKVVDDERLADEVIAYATGMMENSPLGLWLTKQALQANVAGTSYEAALDLEIRGVSMSKATEDGREKRMSKFWERSPIFTNR